VLEDLFHSIGIFTTNGSWAFDPAEHVNRLYKIMAIFMPVVTVIGFVEVVTGGVVPFLIRQRAIARLRLGASGVVVCGCNDHGLSCARAAGRTSRVVLLLDDAPPETLAQRAYRAGIPVLPLRSLNRSRLGALLLKRCDLFSFLPATDAQIDLVARIGARLTQPSERRFCFMIEERGMAQRLDSYLRFNATDRNFWPRFFDIHVLTARQLLAKHRLDVLADVADQSQIHIAVFGMGALGRAIVKEAARLMVTLPSIDGVALRVTAIDTDAQAGVAALEAEDPQIGNLLDLGTLDMRLPKAGLTAAQIRQLPEDVTAYFITVDDADLAFAAAVSLRHWLLEPPADVTEDWRRSHGCAPILIRARDWNGLGRLIRSNVDWPAEPEAATARTPELPDGIFGFGVAGDIVNPEMILAQAREAGARVLHQSYRWKIQAMRAEQEADSLRSAERDWHALASDLRDLNLYGYDHIALKARAIGHRLARAPAAQNPSRADMTPAEIPPTLVPFLPLLSQLEHRRYMAERIAGGWRYATTRCDELKLHPALVDWSDLPDAEQGLDEDQVRSMVTALRHSNLRLLPGCVIGVAGTAGDVLAGSDIPTPVDAARLRETLRAVVRDNPDQVPTLLTTMCPGLGLGLAAAAAAHSLGVPWTAVLPLPFELYREDFTPEDRSRLQELIAYAESYVELPLRFGRASDLTRGHPENRARRADQYAFADAFIIERAHVLLTHSTLPSPASAWWSGHAAIPDRYRTRAAFLPRPTSRNPEILHAAAAHRHAGP
jgi:hypothetical protein